MGASHRGRYRALMLEVASAHASFSRVWNRVRDAEIRRRNLPDPRGPYRSNYPCEQLWAANHVAYDAAEQNARTRNELLGRLFELVPWQRIYAGEPEAIDCALDFIETDVRAFRCGYAKQWLLRRLKRVPLEPQHVERLAALLVELCRHERWGRELRDLTRLLIPHADPALVRELQHLGSPRAARALGVLRNGRRDLRA